MVIQKIKNKINISNHQKIAIQTFCQSFAKLLSNTALMHLPCVFVIMAFLFFMSDDRRG